MGKFFQEYFRIIFDNFPFWKTFHSRKNHNTLINSILVFENGKLSKTTTYTNFSKKKTAYHTLSTICNNLTDTKVRKKRALHYI